MKQVTVTDATLLRDKDVTNDKWSSDFFEFYIQLIPTT